MAIREGRWDCQYCGAVGIQGRHKACGSCGRSRPAGTRFYLPTDAQIVEEERLLAEARIGPDWVCAFCDSSNPANLDVCYSCRAARDEDARDQAVVSYGLDAVPTVGDNADPEELDAAPQLDPSSQKAEREPQRPQPGRPRWLPALLVGIFLLTAILGRLLEILRIDGSCPGQDPGREPGNGQHDSDLAERSVRHRRAEHVDVGGYAGAGLLL